MTTGPCRASPALSEDGYYRGGALSTVAGSETHGPLLIHKKQQDSDIFNFCFKKSVQDAFST